MILLKPYGTPEPERTLLKGIAEVVCIHPGEIGFSEALRCCEAMMADIEIRVGESLLSQAVNLRAIVCRTIGVDFVDLEAAKRHGVCVVNSPSYCTEAVAEHAIALMFALSRRIVMGCDELRAGRWGIREQLRCCELTGKRLGILGFGRIGQRIAEMAHGLGMRVGACDISDAAFARNGFDYVRRFTLEELLAESDVLTVHMPITPETRGLIGSEQLETMKPSALLINVARGGIIDEDAALKALRSGKIGGLALDVFEVEPPSAMYLERSKGLNFVCTPHMAWNSEEAKLENDRVFISQIRAIVAQKRPEHLVVKNF